MHFFQNNLHFLSLLFYFFTYCNKLALLFIIFIFSFNKHFAASKCFQRLKKLKLNFEECKLDLSTEQSKISSNLIQIAAEEKEINRRIQCFVQRKREEIDLHNVMDYTAKIPTDQQEVSEEHSSCARTDSIIVKQEASKGHLKGIKRYNLQITYIHHYIPTSHSTKS